MLANAAPDNLTSRLDLRQGIGKLGNENTREKAHKKREREKSWYNCGGNWSLERMFYRQLLLLIGPTPAPKGWQSLGAGAGVGGRVFKIRIRPVPERGCWQSEAIWTTLKKIVMDPNC